MISDSDQFSVKNRNKYSTLYVYYVFVDLLIGSS